VTRKGGGGAEAGNPRKKDKVVKPWSPELGDDIIGWGSAGEWRKQKDEGRERQTEKRNWGGGTAARKAGLPTKGVRRREASTLWCPGTSRGKMGLETEKKGQE